MKEEKADVSFKNKGKDKKRSHLLLWVIKRGRDMSNMERPESQGANKPLVKDTEKMVRD